MPIWCGGRILCPAPHQPSAARSDTYEWPACNTKQPGHPRRAVTSPSRICSCIRGQRGSPRSLHFLFASEGFASTLKLRWCSEVLQYCVHIVILRVYLRLNYRTLLFRVYYCYVLLFLLPRNDKIQFIIMYSKSLVVDWFCSRKMLVILLQLLLYIVFKTDL